VQQGSTAACGEVAVHFQVAPGIQLDTANAAKPRSRADGMHKSLRLGEVCRATRDSMMLPGCQTAVRQDLAIWD